MSDIEGRKPLEKGTKHVEASAGPLQLPVSPSILANSRLSASCSSSMMPMGFAIGPNENRGSLTPAIGGRFELPDQWEEDLFLFP